MNQRAFVIGLYGLCLPASGCFFVSDFDGLEGAGATSTGTSTGDGAGGTAPGGLGGGGSGGEAAGAQGVGGALEGGGGSGGQSMCPPPGVDYGGLVLNEMAPKGLPEDWIELRNNSAWTIPLCAAFITQGYDGISPPGGDDRYTFGEVSIGPGEYLVIHSPTDFPFGLAKDEPERVTLFSPDSTVIDNTEYVADLATEFTSADSWARIPDASGPWERSAVPSKGIENADAPGSGGGGGTGGQGGR